MYMHYLNSNLLLSSLLLYGTICYASFFRLSYLNFLDPAQVVRMPRETYLPAGMGGTIVCPVQAEPPMLFVNWTKDGASLDIRQVLNKIMHIHHPNYHKYINRIFLDSKVCFLFVG